MDATGTIIFSTVGRSCYGFDVFSLPLPLPSPPPRTDLLLTDTISVNFNAQFVDDNHTLVFISERTGSPRVYLTQPGSSPKPNPLPSAPGSLFHDRPILSKDTRVLLFISAHQQPSDPHLYRSWSALYSTSTDTHDVTRLTPQDVVDYSPAMSESGQLIAVASYGSKPWGGDFNQLQTDIVVFPLSDPTKRTLLAKHGGWPTWCGDSTIYFHRQSDDGWWSIYRIDLGQDQGESPRRITPPGVHAFTPAAMHHGNKIAVATRRKNTPYRHIEIFDINSGEFQPLTVLVNPETHHYNPFVSPGSKYIGYHRFRGDQIPATGHKFIPNLEMVTSPIQSLKMLRINGQFPAFSADGEFIAYNHDFEQNPGVTIMKSDGSKRWNLIKDQIAFHNSWNPADKNVIYTSLGGIFQPAQTSVQVARLTFDAANLDDDPNPKVEVKILTKPESGNNGFPACSPDGKSVVFRSGRSGYKNLYIMDSVNGEMEGGRIHQLTKGEWTDTMPSWSPDGKLIAFSSNRHEPGNEVTFGIYLVNPDGSNLRRVWLGDDGNGNGNGMERLNHVCFSPNGEWLLFTGNMSGVTAEPISMPNQFQPYGDLFVVRLDGSGLRRLTWNGYENGTPAWHRNIVNVNMNMAIAGGDCDALKPQFHEPLWITCDI